MKEKIKQIYLDFAETFDLSSFFCITQTYYKDCDHFGINALAKYTWELDMYLMEQGFSCEYDDVYHWNEYKKGIVKVTLNK